MNVLSLFDGISCGMVALERAGINVDNYFASEIDKYAQMVSENNYPDIIRLGDVTKINTKDLPKINILIGGSPCQSFSFAGKMAGMSTKENIEITTLKQYLKLKKEGFEFNGQSYLFWEYVRILKEVKPKYFLLENVKMLKKWQDIISDTLGVEPILINSNLVSAQNRKRLYWTNIPNIEQPKDKKIMLSDILEDGIGIKYNRNDKEICEIDKAVSICASDWRGLNRNQTQTAVKIKTIPHGYMKESIDEKEKYPSLCAQSPDSKHLIIRNPEKYLPEVIDGNILDPYNKKEIKNGKSNSLRTNYSNGNAWVKPQEKWRRLSVIECERLQTLPDDYTSSVSKTQRYKAIGNGWTVDVIAHIFGYLPEEYKLR